MSWYLGQFWWLLLLGFALGVLVGYWWWRRQFRRTQVSSSSSTQGTCGHGPLLAEKDAEIKRLRAAVGSADTAHAAADLSDGGASVAAVHGLADGTGDALDGDVDSDVHADSSVDRSVDASADGSVEGWVDGETAAQDVVDAGAVTDGSDVSADASPAVGGQTEVDDSVDGAGEAAGDREAGLLDDAEATTRVHLAGDGAGLAPEVDSAALENAGSAGAGAESVGVVAALAGAGHVEATPDDLERVEGIGPRIAGALKAAGIHTFRTLSESDVASLQSALEAGGLRFAPSLPTWARQARLLADGDEDGFKALTDRLVAGRDTGSNG